MLVNGVNCDIYVGKGAGKQLLNNMRNATKSIQIVSPYLSPFLISELIQFNNRNLKIELITTDNIEDYRSTEKQNIIKLIKQSRKTDEIALAKRQKWKSIKRILTFSTIGLLIAIASISFITGDFRFLLFGTVPILIALFAIDRLSKMIDNKRIYNYWYSQLFPFKVFISPYQSKASNTFIHSKIYIIDDKIAYLGSLNFTSSGTKHNYETRIRTEDLNAIRELKFEFNHLWNDFKIPERDIQAWGSHLYPEPIN